MRTGEKRAPTPANRLGLDYRAEAHRLGPPPTPIIDAHAHINGSRAVRIYQQAAQAFGVGLTFSQTQLAHASRVKDILGDSVRFIAIPDYMDPDRHHAHRHGFLRNIGVFRREHGARVMKIWSSPRFRDYFDGEDATDLLELDSSWRVRAVEAAVDLGMMIMVHVADPDTWFATRYSDAAKYGRKADHYAPLERMLDRFPVPWLAAHMCGWPEDLGFLDGLMERHPNLHLDTSATKWMVRELSKQPSERVAAFLTRWKGRVLFGSDIVTSEEHLSPNDPDSEHYGAHLAADEEEAFDLYASRYFALRTLLETDHDGPSPIADPDLEMVDPDRYDAMSAPRLRGHALPAEVLRSVYAGAASALLLGHEGVLER